MDDIKINGLTADEWEELANPQQPTNEDLVGLGVVQQADSQETAKSKPEIAERQDYEDLGYWQTVGDELTAGAVELSKFVTPKKYELNYTPRTRAGEAFQTFSKYLYGIGGLFLGGEVAAVAKAGATAKGLTGLAKIAGGTEKVLKGDTFFKTGKAGAKALGVGALNIGTQGVLQGAILDATIHGEDEGRLADMFGETDNAFIDWLQTDPNDSTATAKLKNVVDGALFSIGINGVMSAASPILERMLKNVKFAKQTKDAGKEIANETGTEIAKDSAKLERIAKTSDLVDTIKKIKEECVGTNEDASQRIIDTLHPENIQDGQTILKMLNDGEDIFVHSDGTFDIKINNWDDAYKVSEEEYKKQLKAQDEISAGVGNEVRYGDTALTHQDGAVKHTWVNRGWIGENEELTKANANKVAKNYKDKFQIDNNIKVEFVDGLKVAGQEVEGNTSATSFLGKTAKNKQNAIDKKALQVQKLQDKVTMLEGGNAPVMEALDAAKEELRIAQNELKELQNTAKGKNLKPNITIRIDKNAKNPYATLRAELEHARDIAKGEVPKEEGKHFARYNGTNEGEVAGSYTYKKSVGRNNILNQPKNTFDSWYGNKQAESTIGDLINNEAFKSEGLLDDVADIKVKHTNSDSLPMETPLNDTHTLGGYVTIENGEPVIYTNSNLSKELVEENLYHELQHARDIKTAYLNPNASLEERMTAYQDIQEVMNAVSSGDVEAYKNSKYEVKADLNRDFLKNKKKEYYDRQQTTTLTGGSSDNNEIRFSHEGNAETVDGDRGLGQGNSFSESVGNTSANIQGAVGQSSHAEQLRLDFDNKINSAVSMESLTDGSLVTNSVEDIDKTTNKTIELSPKISGTTWEAICKDAEATADLMINAERLGLDNELKEAISLNDVTTLDKITRKVLAAQELSSHLAEKLATLGENPPMETMESVIDLIQQIKLYTKETGSASGRMLQARKLVNRAVETFGSLRLSELTQSGISELADLLQMEINKIDLNFTRGSLVEKKQALMESLLQNQDSPFIKLLADEEEIAGKFDSILDELFKEGNITPQKIEKKLQDAITESLYKEVYEATKLTSNPKNKVQVVQNWCDKQGGFTSYYVHNLLSGVGTLAKNIISGGMNTVYFPAKKIVAGYLGGGEALKAEGWNTYKNLLSNWTESWNLCKDAFLNGDGKLSMMRDTMNLGEDEVFNGFREFDFNDTSTEGVWYSIQNFHSIMTRAMGASDEFMSQLNYRSITRAKAINKAEKLATKFGITDEAIKNKIADSLFNESFDSAGKPLDVEAFAEAKDVLYQTPLNGEIYDNAHGEMVKVRDKSITTELAGALNSIAAKNPFMKVMFPFVKTGANILQQNLEHNGIYALCSSNQRRLLASNTKEGALARSQVAFGSFSFMLGAGLALSGRVTGSAPTDPKERKALFETGWKPYSVVIGGKYVSYQGYEPVQTILGFAADSVNIFGTITNSEDEDKWSKFTQQVMSTALNNFLDKAAFRTGLRQLSCLVSPDEDNAEKAAQALVQTAQGFLPNVSFVRNMSSLGKRDATTPKSTYERLFNNYFNRGLGGYRRDAFGNRQDITGMIITNTSSKNTDQPEYKELERLAEFGFNPSEISKTISETTLKYREFKNPETGRSIYDTMQEELSTVEIDGKTLQEAVRELVESDEYNQLPDGVNMNGVKWSASDVTKINEIKDLFKEYNNKALNNVINEYGDLYVDRKGRTISEAVEDVQLEKMKQSIQDGLNDNISAQIQSFGQ